MCQVSKDRQESLVLLDQEVSPERRECLEVMGCRENKEIPVQR